MSPPISQTFDLFPLLAPELRLKIWQFACLQRTVSLRYIPERDLCVSTTPPPAVLHISHESREEGLKTYRLSFATRSSPAQIYFNPYLDTLYRPRWRQMGYDDALRDFRSFLLPSENTYLDNLRRIAVDYIDPAIKRPWEAYNRAALMRSFPKLEQVIMVLKDGMEREVGDDEFVEPCIEAEEILRMWIEFRRSIVMEEKVLEDVAKTVGEEYVKWDLPVVKARAKGRAVMPRLETLKIC